jgi:hypothetical protein
VNVPRDTILQLRRINLGKCEKRIRVARLKVKSGIGAAKKGMNLESRKAGAEPQRESKGWSGAN